MFVLGRVMFRAGRGVLVLGCGSIRVARWQCGALHPKGWGAGQTVRTQGGNGLKEAAAIGRIQVLNKHRPLGPTPENTRRGATTGRLEEASRPARLGREQHVSSTARRRVPTRVGRTSRVLCLPNTGRSRIFSSQPPQPATSSTLASGVAVPTTASSADAARLAPIRQGRRRLREPSQVQR